MQEGGGTRESSRARLGGIPQTGYHELASDALLTGAGRKQGAPVVRGVDRERQRADLVGGVAVGRDAVRAGDDRVHAPRGDERGRRGVHHQRRRQAVVHQLVRRQARPWARTPRNP